MGRVGGMLGRDQICSSVGFHGVHGRLQSRRAVYGDKGAVWGHDVSVETRVVCAERHRHAAAVPEHAQALKYFFLRHVRFDDAAVAVRRRFLLPQFFNGTRVCG